MASQFMVDLYDCDAKILNNLEQICTIAHQIIKELPAEIVEECTHQFSPIGITYIAVITTSHFSIHTWPENAYAAVDIFSCKDAVPKRIATKLQEAFHAKRIHTHQFERDIEGRN